MNIILFEESELTQTLSSKDARITHIRRILRLQEGEKFAAGILGKEQGYAVLEAHGEHEWIVHFTPEKESTKQHPISLIIGCPRPPVARRLIKDLSTMGVENIHICASELNEKSYLTAKLWRDNLWHTALMEGAMQAGSTHIPKLHTAASLQEVLRNISYEPTTRYLAFDNNSDALPFSQVRINYTPTYVAIGPERGWSDAEGRLFTMHQFTLIRFGERILRTETACSLAVGLILERWGIY